MNLLLIIMAILLVCNVVQCYKRGMVKSIISLISLIVLCVIAALLCNGIRSYVNGQIVQVIVMVFLLCLVGIVQHLLGVAFFSAKMIAKLPVVHFADKVLGVVVGILETVLIIWTIYTIMMILDTGMIGQQILEYTRESQVLLWFYEHNRLASWVQQLGIQFPTI